jgi:hypothetical protein
MPDVIVGAASQLAQLFTTKRMSAFAGKADIEISGCDVCF